MKKGPAFTFQLTREGIENRLGEMEHKMDRLRSLYESYFMGMEKVPPNHPRRELNRMMLEMQQVPIGNSALRFRFQALTQKWVLHMTYWNRTLREIEAGTYRRDVARMQRHLAERGGAITEEDALAIGIPKNRVKAFVARQQLNAAKKQAAQASAATETPAQTSAAAPAQAPAAPQVPAQAPAAARAPAPRLGPPPIPQKVTIPGVPTAPLAGVSDQEFEYAYRTYCDAHKQLGIEAQAVAKEKMRSRLIKQLPRILDEQGCARVRLEIAIEDGKVRLRAWPDER